MRLRIHPPRNSAMTDLDKLLRQYIERFEAGGDVDPNDLLSQARAGEREQLRELIAGYLEHAAPGQDWDARAFEGSLSQAAVEQVKAEWQAAEGELPTQLVKLRNDRQITRADLVTRLAESLGASGARERVASYYHRLERGMLPAEGVSSRVWEALAKLLDTSADALRRAGAEMRPPPTPGAASAYARTAAPPPPEYATAQSSEEPTVSDTEHTEEPDEVDRLFTGG